MRRPARRGQLKPPVGAEQDVQAPRIHGTALFHRMTMDAVSDLDLPCTPPLGSPRGGPSRWAPGRGSEN